MELQKLSSNVNKRATQSIRRTILGLCLIAGIAIIGVVLFYSIQNNTKQVKLYSSEIDESMSEKMAFINTVAAGASSGAVGDASGASDAATATAETENGTAGSDYYAYLDKMVEQYEDVSAVYICVEQADAVYQDGIMTYMSGGWVPDADFVVSERSWFTGAKETEGVYISEPYVDEQSGNICITLSKAIYRNGRFIGVAGMDMYMDDLVKLIENSYQGGDYVFLTSAEGTILTHPNDEIALTADSSFNVKDALNGKYQSVCKNQLKTKLIWDYSGGVKFAISNVSPSTNWNVVAVISVSWIIILVFGIIVISIILGIVIGKMSKNRLLKAINPMFMPLEELAQNVSKISDGELAYHFEVDDQSQEVNALSLALNDTMKELQHYISEITNTVTAISEKNLNFVVDGEYTGDYNKIKNALVDIMQVLNECFVEINEQAATVLNFSENLSATSESVAESATSQSESVINASNEMKKLTDNMEKIVEYASAIKENTDQTNQCLNLGSDEMKELVEAMDEIAVCYDEIAGFVSEINAIATQTNLLALNAAIEAARAGEAGKGFAVVADEISSLSSSSSESSDKIREVISRSLQSVEKGKDLVERTEKTIADSAGYSVESTKMVDQIVQFVETQKETAGEISGDIRKISKMVESNAASAQENSAISDNLGDCAKSLMDTISQFQLHK